MIKYNNNIFIADAKYKAHFYAYGVKSEALNETHRLDLHQLLAYCSFEPQLHKTGILFYPANTLKYLKIQYSDRIGGICNKIILCGLPFEVAEMEKAIIMIRELFQNKVLKIAK